MIRQYLNSPGKVYLVWILLIFLSAILVIPLLSIGHSGGEQLQMNYLASLTEVAVYGFFILSVFTSFQSVKWVKKYWYINLLLFITSGYLILTTYQMRRAEEKDLFDSSQDTQISKKDTLVINKKFYSNTSKLRSVEYFLNGKKDSTWEVFDNNGHVIHSYKYQNDRLILRSK